MTTAGALLSGPVTGPEPDRAARAWAALARAEERTGTDRWVRPSRPVVLPGVTQDTLPVMVSQPMEQVEPASAERQLPVAPPLKALLPSGGLDRGSTVVVSGSMSLTLALLAEASRAGSWVAVVGLPGVGVLAAHQLGLCLDRVVLVPAPGPDGPTVVAALLDGVDVVVVGPEVALGPTDRRRLSARARERSSVLLPTTPWPGAQVVLTAESSRWQGLGRGWGRLSSRQLTVHRAGRGTAAITQRCEVALPAPPAPWQDGAPATPTWHERPEETRPGSGDLDVVLLHEEPGGVLRGRRAG